MRERPEGQGAPPGSPVKFGTLLRDFRCALEWTQATLAERAGLSVRGIQHLESGKTQPFRRTVERLAKALPLSPEERGRLEAAALPTPRRRQPASRSQEPSQGPLAGLPTGTVTLLFVEVGLPRRGPEPGAGAITADRCLELVRACLQAAGCRPTPSSRSERLCVAAFARAGQAVIAAVQLREMLRSRRDPLLPAVRVALHTGGAQIRRGEYQGAAVAEGAQLLAMADWGQTVLSEATVILAQDALQAASGSSLRAQDLDEVVSQAPKPR
jgi:transcriptional regulator with XRE-family HTH domain